MAWQNLFWIQLVNPVQLFAQFLLLFEVANGHAIFDKYYGFTVMIFFFLIIFIVSFWFYSYIFFLVLLLTGHKRSLDVATILQGDTRFYSVLMLAWGKNT